MVTISRTILALGLGVVGLAGSRAEGQSSAPSARSEAPALEAPATDLDPIAPAESTQTTKAGAIPPPPVTGAVPDNGAAQARVYAPKQPPAPIVERPFGSRPAGKAVWVSGYWDWDAERERFVWVAGSWQVPAAGMVRVDTRWVRDRRGWYQVPGYWRPRAGQGLVETQVVVSNSPEWRKNGPPAEQPDDLPGAAPGPDYFYIPGHYRPEGDRLAWRGGFWARSQPGWDWIPARWVRRADGWQFREGNWVRDPDTALVNRDRSRRPTAPPPPADQPDERDDLRIVDPDADVVPDRDAPVIVEGRTVMPYYVIRPPGSYPYGPGGVIVPGAVPPFVRRLLDRVLP